MKSLYRKYRPLKLSEVVGQKQVTEVLAGALKAGKIGHAYLFVGPRGCGKTSVARILAHEVNGFKYELEDDYVDIIEIDGASNRGIDDIRELREKATIAPTSGKYKVYIIDEVHMLTTPAFNALLKTLEEPPRHVIFIMATTDAYKVPPTITSRSQIFTFKLADKQVMFDFLKSVAKKEKIRISDEALKIIAKRGGGSFRDSMSLLDQISTLSQDEITKEMVVNAMGLPEDEKIEQLLNEYVSGDVVKITTLIKELLSEGLKAETLAEEMVNSIIDNPQAQFMPLLAKLPEVKEPFAEAKLLVALMARVAENAFFTDVSRFSSPETYIPDGAEKAARRADFPGRPVYDVEGEKVGPEKGVSTRTRATAPSKGFDWRGFLEKMRGVNEVIHQQLAKCEFEVEGNVLHLYPRTGMIKTILESKNNQRILINNVGELSVKIHAVGEHPKSVKKDATLVKISDIMGGEVAYDGGDNPF